MNVLYIIVGLITLIFLCIWCLHWLTGVVRMNAYSWI